ncbi:hypothetical protein [Streptomyces sp. NPDC002990]
MRRGAVLSVVVAGLLVLGLGGAGSAQGSARGSDDGAAAGWAGPEADVAYRGMVSLSQGRLRLWVVPENRGPAALANATVRVRLSADLADRQALAEGCARAGQREVVCETGALPRRGEGRHIGLLLELRERAPEVVVRVSTWWNGGATDRNPVNNEPVVLALDTGDTYAF